jgi:tetratricopeptide (TPR) repeat protein
MSRKHLATRLTSPRPAVPKPRQRQRLNAALLVVTLLVGAVTAYLLGVNLWANHHLDACNRAIERYDFEDAGTHLDKYLFVHPSDAQALLLLAQLTRRRGDFAEASRRLRRAEERGAPAQAVNTERLLYRIQTGNLTEAPGLAQFCTAHASEPSGALALEVLIEGSYHEFNLALMKWAVDLWLEQRTGTADQAQGLVWRGRLNEMRQNFPQALVDFQRAAELEPDSHQARLCLVVALIREEPRAAVAHLEWMRRRRPSDPDVLLQTARLRRNLGQPEEAGHLLDELLASSPNKLPALIERGRVAMDLNRPGEAEHWLRHALEVAPGQREPLLALVDCLRQCGRLDEAKQLQARADEIDAELKKKVEELSRKGGK